MNEQFVIEFIRQRMLQMGVSNYHFEALFLSVPTTGLSYDLSNEFWYLVGYPQDISIVSDSAIYYYNASNFYFVNPPEFTGNVQIVASSTGLTAQFVRVIIQK